MESRRFVDPKVDSIEKTERRLPHWTAESAVYFLTFRTFDSIPTKFQIELRKERERIKCLSGQASLDARRAYLKQANQVLDSSYGFCPFRQEHLAQIVIDELMAIEPDFVNIFAWCIMPNHVHALLATKPAAQLSEAMRLWKGRSSRRINQSLSRTGTFWQEESFDHLVRNGEKFLKFARYICDNPTKAGLQNWKWIYVESEIATF